MSFDGSTTGLPEPLVPDAQALHRVFWLKHVLEKCQYLPVPPDHLQFVGAGDFHIVGRELAGQLIAYTDMMPRHSILDVGAGCGRVAMPLAHYLRSNTPYVGIEPVQKAVHWCRYMIGGRYPNFDFRLLPVAHDLYNPIGKGNADELEWPVEADSFDRITCTSVLTHLAAPTCAHYARQMARALKPGGIAFVTFFLIDSASLSTSTAFAFEPWETGDGYTADLEAPLGAVGFAPSQVHGWFAQAGLVPYGGPVRGRWSGLTADGPYQDVWCWQKPEK